MNRKSLIAVALLAGLTGCSDSPYDRTKNGSGGGPTGSLSATNNYIIFSSELSSGGGAFLYPGAEEQSLTFSDRSNPISERSIRYRWTGESVASQTLYAGFNLMHTPTQATYTSTVGRDLRSAGYTQVTFYIRGTLSTNTIAKVEVADDGNTGTANTSCVSLSTDGTGNDPTTPCVNTGTLSTSWQKVTITIATPATPLANVKDFFKVTFVYNPLSNPKGQGGEVFIDQIQYEP